ncbi:zinc finger protein [Macleaya cordata]|uniref:Zinc finger protein n=1 Tax=Macleaya cordata TaxID=56857 RepID=A0A200R3N0_MACCD|nr:zinc finger protein [Macleaya cordata]
MVTPQYARHRLLLVVTEREMPPPTSESRPRGSYTSESNFDTNMVIILAALLCALICALGLNSIVRCALRCGRRFENPNEAAARTGLKKRALRQIPVAVYGSGALNLPATDCPICLGEFMDGEKVRVLPKCNHGFHMRCIDTWLMSHSSCPTCRHSLLERPMTSSDDAAAHDHLDVASIRQPENGSRTDQGGLVVVVADERS